MEEPISLRFRMFTAKYLDVQIYRVFTDLRRVMRKPTLCICKNKVVDQLRGNREAEAAPLFSLHG